ncbi:lipocalin family protein [uncultured Croceitalea sp.]|uniref:lipocalin family protein n=1 Tax=uncultured Croceitalea sp. TaxID=1798908 RepID=UPI0033057417
MKTIQILPLLGLLLVSLACSSDDDADDTETPSTQNLLTTGIWYQESKSPGGFSDCEKNSSVAFATDGTVRIESFEEEAGSCEAQTPETASYTLNGATLVFTAGPETFSATINSISSEMLSVTDDEGATVVFDRTQG